MLGLRISAIAVASVLIASAASAQGTPEDKSAASGALCVPGALVEAKSEGAWYPAVVLDPLRDGRCFVHYEGYGSDDDEAMSPGSIRSRR